MMMVVELPLGLADVELVLERGEHLFLEVLLPVQPLKDKMVMKLFELEPAVLVG